jgi:hypothetical protein
MATFKIALAIKRESIQYFANKSLFLLLTPCILLPVRCKMSAQFRCAYYNVISTKGVN